MTNEPINLESSVDYSGDSIVSRVVLKSNGGNLTLFAFDKGQGLSEHSAPFDAAVFMVEGELELGLGAERFQLKAGELMVLPANIPHSLQAQSRVKLLLIMFKQ